jgi:hypothetical protein
MKPLFMNPVEVRSRLLAGEDILLVSVFGDQVHRRSHLEGSISLDELERQSAKLDRRKTIVFY